jgi:hypothetical protein
MLLQVAQWYCIVGYILDLLTDLTDWLMHARQIPQDFGRRSTALDVLVAQRRSTQLGQSRSRFAQLLATPGTLSLLLELVLLPVSHK